MFCGACFVCFDLLICLLMACFVLDLILIGLFWFGLFGLVIVVFLFVCFD